MKYFLLLAAFNLVACAGEVNNTGKPKGKAMTIEFTKDLTIGPDYENDLGLWSGLNVFVSVDKRGHMFVTDSAEKRVVEFDASGKYVQTIGRPGQGPGEFQSLVIFQVNNDGKAIAFENRPRGNIQYFDADKKFVKRENMPQPGHDFVFAHMSPDGRYLASECVIIPTTSPELTYKTSIFGQDLKLIKDVSSAKVPAPNFQTLLQNPEGIVTFLADLIKANINVGYVAFGNDGRVYTANAQEYKVQVWDKDLKTELMTVTRQYKPIMKSEEELTAIYETIFDQLPFPPQAKERITLDMVRRAYEKAEVSPAKSPIFGIVPMEDGQFMVVHDFNQANGKAVADIFDKEGTFLGQVSRPNQTFVGGTNLVGGNKIRMIFKGDYAYSIETINDDSTLVRYKYKLVPAK